MKYLIGNLENTQQKTIKNVCQRRLSENFATIFTTNGNY